MGDHPTVDVALVLDVLDKLLSVLPDTMREDDSSWAWCWNELTSEAQDEVRAARARALAFLAFLRQEAS